MAKSKFFGEKFEHPSFGTIRINRVNSSGTRLFDSALKHEHYMEIEISTAVLNRNLHHNWVFPRDSIVTIALSEAQWARFVSSIGIGGGVPCTIKYRGYEAVEPPPVDLNTRDTFVKEVKEQMSEVCTSLGDALKKAEEIKKKKTVNKGDVAELVKVIERLQTELLSNIPWAQQVFEETTEKTVEAAKAEAEAHMHMAIQRLGMEALALRQASENENLLEVRNAPVWDGDEPKGEK